MREATIDEAALSGADDMHALLARELGFPDYYGANLSALSDCLGDVCEPTRIVVRRRRSAGGGAGSSAGWLDRALRVIERAARENPSLDVATCEGASAPDGAADAPGGAGEAAADGAERALDRLRRGNAEFLGSDRSGADVSGELRARLLAHGQHPFATVVTCADSRVVPEHIFACGLGELFDIRVAGNVVGDVELASAAYAASHLGTPLLLVLGHTHCGAVEAAMGGHAEGALRAVVEPIARAIGDERDPYAASALNVRAQVGRLEADPELARLVARGDLRIVGAVYHTGSGVVDFLGDDAGGAAVGGDDGGVA